MTVLVLERVSSSLKGELSKWMTQVKAGVFVGRVPAGVRDRLWEMACGRVRSGGAVLIHAVDNEQGYTFRLWGVPDRRPEDFEGIFLVRQP